MRGRNHCVSVLAESGRSRDRLFMTSDPTRRNVSGVCCAPSRVFLCVSVCVFLCVSVWSGKQRKVVILLWRYKWYQCKGQGETRESTPVNWCNYYITYNSYIILRLGLIPFSKMSCINTLYCCPPSGDRQVHDASDREYTHILCFKANVIKQGKNVAK